MRLGMRHWFVLGIVLPTSIAGLGSSIAGAAGLDAARLPGIVVDDVAAEASGSWQTSSSVASFVGDSYRYTARGDSAMRFVLRVPSAGTFCVLVSYTAHPNRATNATVLLKAGDAEHTYRVNQQEAPRGIYCFHLLDRVELSAGDCSVTIRADDADGAVVADAVQLIEEPKFAEAQRLAKKDPPPKLAAKPKSGDAKKKKAAPLEPAPVYTKTPPPTNKRALTPGQLDELLAGHLGPPADADLVDDETFLRRATLDILGRTPTLQERRTFLEDRAPTKRADAVQRMLASPQYGENWARYWSEVISYRVPPPELTFLNYKPFEAWLAQRLNADATWDEITFNILTARGKVGDNAAATFVGFHQANTSRLASETTRIFLAVNVQCAECHDHKFIDMPQETFHEMAAYFVRASAKLPWNDSNQIEVKSKEKGEHKMPGGKASMRPVAFGQNELKPGLSDLKRRAELANWIVQPDNPWFAKAYINRIWSQLMGRGFCEPVDEIGQLAEPVLPEVFQAVSDHFAATGNDTKDLIQLIASTSAYQRKAGPEDMSRPLAAAVAQRLRGDAVFESLVCAIEIPNVTPPKAEAKKGTRFPPPPKSTRDLVDEAYGFDPSLPKASVSRTMRQAMFMMNNAQVQRLVDASPESGTMLAKLVASEQDDQQVIDQLYRRVLGREPKPREMQIARKHLQQIDDRETAFEDLLWSLLNSAEFVTRR